MTWLADLSPYTLHPNSELRAVGWLERGRDYSKGRVSEGFIQKLRQLATDPWLPYRSLGVHFCDFCDNAEGANIVADDEDLSGKVAGTIEFFVPGKSVVYVVPSLILHYIEAHDYYPPPEFMKAVWACPPMGTEPYLKAIRDNGGSCLIDHPTRQVSMNNSANHDNYMWQALELAHKGGSWVSPNPKVGAVVVRDDGVILGQGWHQQYGGPHAEVFALQEARDKARGATLYCTLEPCNHTGKTPPCTQAVIAAGIKTVVVGSLDPNPVASGGIATLRSAGIDVVTGVLEAECRALNAPFFKAMQSGLPFVSLKWAMSADGKIAAAGGDSKWITSEASRAYAHRLRANHDAVLVGINTLIADGARLNARAESGAPALRQRRRVILDSSARTPLDAPIFSAEGGAIVLVCATDAPADRVAALQSRGATVISLPRQGSAIPIDAVLKALLRERIQSVLVEGGGSVLGSFADSRCADRAYIFIAPKIIGGRESVAAVGGHGVSRVAECLELRSPRVDRLGSDVLMTGALSAWDWDDGVSL